MNRKEVVDIIKDRMGFHTNFDDAIIYRHLDFVQQHYERVVARVPLAWFLLDTGYTDTTVVDQRHLDVPTGYISMHDNWPLLIEDAEGNVRELQRIANYDLASDDRTEKGLPTHYTLDGKKFYFYPLPDNTYTITIPHYARSTPLSESSTHDWFDEFPTLIVEETLLSIFKSIRDIDGIRVLNLQEERQNYHDRIVELEHVGRNYVANKNG